MRSAVNLLNFSENLSLEILNDLNALKMCLRNVLLWISWPWNLRNY